MRHHQGFDITVADHAYERKMSFLLVVFVMDETLRVYMSKRGQVQTPALRIDEVRVRSEANDRMLCIYRLRCESRIDRDEPQGDFEYEHSGAHSDAQC